MLYQVVRKHPKAFLQRKPDGAGGWDWTTKGVRRVLYHLPDIVNADRVYVVEGEKSADKLSELGVVATTNAGGAGKWKSVYSKQLEDKDVVIIPDEDDAGRDHASKVAASLQGSARRVRVVHLPVVASKSDPYDWVQAGGTLDELEELVEQTDEQGASPVWWDSDNGPPQSDDYIRALEALGYEFKMNECNNRVMVNGEPINDALEAVIKTDLRDYNYRAVNVARDAWTAHAYRNSFHPARDWLDDLEWDGHDHIGDLADYFEDENSFFYMFLKRWLIGAVARACEGRVQNRMLVLDGKQGIGKSYFTEWLASAVDKPELFVEGPIDPDEKDDKIRLMSTWIWEVAELGSTTRKADREALKYFLSLKQVTVRVPYGRHDLVKPALSNFIGTVNNTSGFLNDPTGHRRFMSVHLRDIDWDYAEEVDPEQVWAQAKALYEAGQPWKLSEQEAECAQYANEQYEVEDPLEDLFNRHFEVTGNPADFTPTVDIRNTLNEHNWSLGSPRGEAMAISDMLQGEPVEKKRRTVSGNRERGYVGVKKRDKVII
jgi:predicted P-loop ATPase